MVKADRLRKTADFERVFGSGRSLANRYLVLYYADSTHSDLRVGFSVSRRVGGAVCRNRVKRLLRVAVHDLAAPIPAGMDLVVVARKGAAGLGLRETKTALADLLRRAGLAE